MPLTYYFNEATKLTSSAVSLVNAISLSPYSIYRSFAESYSLSLAS